MHYSPRLRLLHMLVIFLILLACILLFLSILFLFHDCKPRRPAAIRTRHVINGVFAAFLTGAILAGVEQGGSCYRGLLILSSSSTVVSDGPTHSLVTCCCCYTARPATLLLLHVNYPLPATPCSRPGQLLHKFARHASCHLSSANVSLRHFAMA